MTKRIVLPSELPKPRKVLSVLAALLLGACGGGGGDESGPAPPPPPPPPPPSSGVLALAASTYQASESSAAAQFTVTRSSGSSGRVTVDVTATSGTATEGDDFESTTATVMFEDGDTDDKTGSVVIIDDDSDETNETFALTLSNVTGGATIGTLASATVTILDDDLPPAAEGNGLNDTGVTVCATATETDLPCSDPASGTDAYAGQDAELGRDASADDDSDGRAGFSFTKLDANGAPLSDQSVDYATSPWACVRDEVTGLTWEIKTDDGGLRDADWRYTWFSSLVTGIGDPGEPGGETCDPGCDTERFIAEVNANGLCGFSDWRLPTRHELVSLMDYGATDPPAIDTAFFPNTKPALYWTSSLPAFAVRAYYVGFDNGQSLTADKSQDLAVRLVREGD